MNHHNKRVTTHYYRLTPRVPGGMRLFPIISTRPLIVLDSYWSTRGVYQSESFVLRVHLIISTHLCDDQSESVHQLRVTVTYVNKHD